MRTIIRLHGVATQKTTVFKYAGVPVIKGSQNICLHNEGAPLLSYSPNTKAANLIFKNILKLPNYVLQEQRDGATCKSF